MLKLHSLKSDKIWGYELWIASTHPNGCQKDFLEYAGSDYPLLVKVIQADDVLSVQVHPDDILAKKFENCRGKTECWYVLKADEGAKLVYGMNGKYTDDELRSAINTNTLEDKLKWVSVKTGDFVYIPSGTVHAIGGGLRLMEVQQSSDITYRLYDWGRGRECHVEKGIACIKEYPEQKVVPFPGHFQCPYFELDKINVNGSLKIVMRGRCEKGDVCGYTLAYVLEGSGTFNGQPCTAEDIFAFSDNEMLEVTGNLSIMKITCTSV